MLLLSLVTCKFKDPHNNQTLLSKTLLFGNGLNQLTTGLISWKDLLDNIKGKNKFENLELPHTMIYERILMERTKLSDGIFAVEGNIKAEIAEQMRNISTNEYYDLVFNLGLKNYLTTNYDYSLNKKIKQNGFALNSNSTEDIYSIRRNTSILDNKDQEIGKIWNIHGEVDRPASIMLGLDHYCSSIGKLDAYLKGTYEYQDNKQKIRVNSITNKIKNGDFDKVSWVELFFNSDVHILGLSLKYSETDLWWILNKRARIMNDKKTSVHISNKIFYYSTSIEPEKQGVLESFNVKVIKTDNPNPKTFNWGKYYRETLDKIASAK
jgi:hypothetical protein